MKNKKKIKKKKKKLTKSLDGEAKWKRNLKQKLEPHNFLIKLFSFSVAIIRFIGSVETNGN